MKEGRAEILSIREAPLANNSTNKQREPPLLAFVDKKKSAPPKQCCTGKVDAVEQRDMVNSGVRGT